MYLPEWNVRYNDNLIQLYGEFSGSWFRMRAAKSIDELYKEVRDYDLVMCNDAPLALALNNRLDKPRLGAFAITPRQLAGDLSMDILGRALIDDIEVVKKVSRLTGCKLRYVHGEIENYKKIRKYTNDVKKYLRGKKTKMVYDEYVNMPTLEKAMEGFDGDTSDFFKGKNIAVIGTELYDSLDKMMNPKFGTFEEINPFKKGCFEINEFRELSNDRQIAENAADLITKENASDVAIVLDVGGPIADAVRSALYRKKIPFINNLNVRDLNNIRDFLEFLTRSLTFSTVKIGQIRELISTYGGIIKSRYDEYLAEQFIEMTDHERTKELLTIMRDITKMTYLDVCDRVTRREGAQVKILLSEMELSEEYVTQMDTDDMIYAVNNFNDLKHNEQIPAYEKEGVLLVDCKNSVYIDRPIIIYLGLGTDWDKDLSDLNLVDYSLKDDEVDKNTMKFQILLQQGSKRVYMCNSVKDGKKPKPCSMFEYSDMNGRTYEEFRDIAKCIGGPWYRPADPEPVKNGSVQISSDYKLPKFSKSSFNNFISCPRMYLYGNLLGNPDDGRTVMGNLLHEYAEFRICYPDIAKEKGREYYVQYISDLCLGLFTPDIRDLKTSKIRNAIKNIDLFIGGAGFSSRIIMDQRKEHQKPNRFFEDASLPDKGSQMTEIRFVSNDEPMEGIIDIADGSHIYDFKTGTPKTIKDIKKSLDLTGKSDYTKESQPLFYLSLVEELSLGDEKFSLFYTSANEIDDALGKSTDVSDNLRHIELFDNYNDIIREYIQEKILSAKKYEKLIGHVEEMVEAIRETGYNKDTLRSKEYAEMLRNRFNIKVDMEMALKKIADHALLDIIELDNVVKIYRGYLNDFRKGVESAHNEASEMYFKEYVARPTISCKNCYFKDVCTMNVERGESNE